MKLGNWN